MSRFNRSSVITLSGAAVLALATACGSSTSHPASTPPSASSSSAQAVLQTAKSSSLGTIVTDKSGFTLYRFDKDSVNPPMSNCNGQCASQWPPELTQGNPTLKGINSSLIGTIDRPDGTKQVTLNGWPLYRFVADTKPGDTKGEGVNAFGALWFASDPTGGKAMPQSPMPSSPGTGGGGGGSGY